MSEAPSGKRLTDGQVAAVYESQLNRTILWHLLLMVIGVAAAVAFSFFIRPMWVMIVLIVLLALVTGFTQRLIVTRLRCPACGFPVLGRIYTIVEARHVETCPGCHVKLRA